MSGLKSTRRMPTRVTIAGRKGGFVVPRNDRHRNKRQLIKSLGTQRSQASGRRVNLMERKYVIKQRKTVKDQGTGGTSVTIQPRIQIRTKRKQSRSPENPPAAPIKKRRISLISNNITQKMMIQVEPTPSVITNLAPGNNYTALHHVPKRNVVRRSEMKQFTINQSINGMAANEDIQLTAVNQKKVDAEKHIFTKVRRSSSRVKLKKSVKTRTKRTNSVRVEASNVYDDSSSVYSYSSDDSVSEDENRRSKKNLGPVIKSTTVTRGGHIMLRNLPKEINARMLMMELFREDGDVINAIVHSDDKGVPLGTGEVVFAKRKEAHNAIVHHCGSVWRGKKIKMTMIGQMIEQPIAKITSRRERRSNDIRKRKRGSLRSAKNWEAVAPPHQSKIVHQSPVNQKDDKYDVVQEPGGDNEEDRSTVIPMNEPYEEETVNHEVEPPDDTLSMAMDRNGLVLDIGTQYSTRAEHKASDASPKRKHHLEYVPAGREDATGYHVTLKNLQQYTYLSELSDSDGGDSQFLRSSFLRSS